MTLVVLAASWKHICYDYLFLVAGLLAVPRSLIEAAAVDGAGPLTRYIRICLPLLSPTLFFLMTMNFVYGFFETFAIIDAVTAGGPAGATSILVYKVFQDGFPQLGSRSLIGPVRPAYDFRHRPDLTAVPLCRAQGKLQRLTMIERSPIFALVCHALLIGGIAIVCLPLYFAFVASTLTVQEVQRVPMQWTPAVAFS